MMNKLMEELIDELENIFRDFDYHLNDASNQRTTNNLLYMMERILPKLQDIKTKLIIMEIVESLEK